VVQEDFTLLTLPIIIIITTTTTVIITVAVMTITTRQMYRVCTDPGKVWKVLEFDVEIFKALKSLENDHRYGKVWKTP